MIYGASGYTRRLVVARAVAQGERPVLAGRTSGPLSELADEFDLNHRCGGVLPYASLRGPAAPPSAYTSVYAAIILIIPRGRRKGRHRRMS